MIAHGICGAFLALTNRYSFWTGAEVTKLIRAINLVFAAVEMTPIGHVGCSITRSVWPLKNESQSIIFPVQIIRPHTWSHSRVVFIYFIHMKMWKWSSLNERGNFANRFNYKRASCVGGFDIWWINFWLPFFKWPWKATVIELQVICSHKVHSVCVSFLALLGCVNSV